MTSHSSSACMSHLFHPPMPTQTPPVIKRTKAEYSKAKLKKVVFGTLRTRRVSQYQSSENVRGPYWTNHEQKQAARVGRSSYRNTHQSKAWSNRSTRRRCLWS